MLSTSLYIIVCSARNRLRMRLRRLREPRYLIGAIVGAAYVYFSVFARMGRRGRRGMHTGWIRERMLPTQPVKSLTGGKPGIGGASGRDLPPDWRVCGLATVR